MAKKNCWEFFNCGREPNGENVKKLGVCPASIEIKWDGTNEGKNAGRICWLVSGTFCKGDIVGTFATRMVSCSNCEFFKLVKKNKKE